MNRAYAMKSDARTLISRIKAIFSRHRQDAEFSDEIREHLDLLTEEYVRRGMPLAEARREAKIRLGSTTQLSERHRDMTGIPFLETLFQDVRYALRMLKKNPGFTAIAVLTLALGIGANAAIFSVVEEVLLRSLPYKNSDRLVDLTEFTSGTNNAGVSFPSYLAWNEQNTVFEETAAYFLISASNDIALGGPSSTERERYSTVTNSFFNILGVQPALGHGFSPENELLGGPKVFLVSDAVWHGLFVGDPHVIGKTYLLDGESFTLVGVMPPGFDFPKGCGVWVPTSTLGTFGLNDRLSHPYHVLSRLRPGVTLAQAQAQIDGIQEHLGKIYPKTDANWHVRAQPLLDEVVGNVRTSLFVLLGAVGFTLLIACSNVANLMLARASTREREFAIRAALGAGRMRLLRQNLTESLLIVCISIVLAVAFAKWGLALIVSSTSFNLPRMEPFHLSLPVLVFLCVVAAFTALLVGLAPGLQASKQESRGVLSEGQRGGTGLQASRLCNGLVVSEVALALILLSGAGLLLRSFAQLIRVNPGFETQHLLTMKIALPSAAYPRFQQTTTFVDRLLQRLRAIPGIQDSAAAQYLPLSGESDFDSFQIVGRPEIYKLSFAGGGGVTLDYFHTLGIPLLRGREFTPADAQNQNTVIINKAMAKKFFSGIDALGQRIGPPGDASKAREIIGVVGDVKSAGLNAPANPETFSPFAGAWYINLIVRANRDPTLVLSAAREQLAALDRGVPMYQVATMDQLISSSIAPQRFNLFLLGLFAALAMILAAIGLFGMLAFSVSRRTREIGVHMALGAQPRDIVCMVLGEGLFFAFIGVAIGVAGALVLTRFLRSLLFEIKPTDPLTFVAVAILLTLVAFAACYIPARRAMRVDPMVALRYE